MEGRGAATPSASQQRDLRQVSFHGTRYIDLGVVAKAEMYARLNGPPRDVEMG